MTRTLPIFLLLLLLPGRAMADGFNTGSLRHVLRDADTLLLVEIVENTQTVVHRVTDGKRFNESYVYTNDIKSKVIRTLTGEFTDEKFDTIYELILVKGVWLSIPGSGLERRMKPGEKYVLLLTKDMDRYHLQRAEKAEDLESILQLKQELNEEDRLIAEAQAKLPSGIYPLSHEAEDQLVLMQDRQLWRVGKVCDFKVVRKALNARYGLFLLSLRVDVEKPGHCILLLDGKAYRLSQNHWAATREIPAGEQKPNLYCEFKDRPQAEAVGMYFDLAIQEDPKPKAQE